MPGEPWASWHRLAEARSFINVARATLRDALVIEHDPETDERIVRVKQKVLRGAQDRAAYDLQLAALAIRRHLAGE